MLIKNIRTLAGIVPADVLRLCGGEMNSAEVLHNAFLVAEDGLIVRFGPMAEMGEVEADEVVDAEGRVVFPAFCDSHSHIVYAGSREGEFRDKIAGMTYQEAKEKLESVGLYLNATGTGETGKVFTQEVEPNTPVEVGTAVEVKFVDEVADDKDVIED